MERRNKDGLPRTTASCPRVSPERSRASCNAWAAAGAIARWGIRHGDCGGSSAEVGMPVTYETVHGREGARMTVLRPALTPTEPLVWASHGLRGMEYRLT